MPEPEVRTGDAEWTAGTLVQLHTLSGILQPFLEVPELSQTTSEVHSAQIHSEGLNDGCPIGVNDREVGKEQIGCLAILPHRLAHQASAEVRLGQQGRIAGFRGERPCLLTRSERLAVVSRGPPIVTLVRGRPALSLLVTQFAGTQRRLAQA